MKSKIHPAVNEMGKGWVSAQHLPKVVHSYLPQFSNLFCSYDL